MDPGGRCASQRPRRQGHQTCPRWPSARSAARKPISCTGAAPGGVSSGIGLIVDRLSRGDLQRRQRFPPKRQLLRSSSRRGRQWPVELHLPATRPLRCTEAGCLGRARCLQREQLPIIRTAVEHL